LDGALIEGVAAGLARLSTMVRLVMITADTHGGATLVRDNPGLGTAILEKGGEATQKLEFVRRLGAEHSVAISNGSNDVLMLKEGAVGICVVGTEGGFIRGASRTKLTTRARASVSVRLLLPGLPPSCHRSRLTDAETRSHRSGLLVKKPQQIAGDGV